MLLALGAIQGVHDRVALLHPTLEHSAFVLVSHLMEERSSEGTAAVRDNSNGRRYSGDQHAYVRGENVQRDGFAAVVQVDSNLCASDHKSGRPT